MTWTNPCDRLPKDGQEIIFRTTEGRIRAGRYLKNKCSGMSRDYPFFCIDENGEVDGYNIADVREWAPAK